MGWNCIRITGPCPLSPSTVEGRVNGWALQKSCFPLFFPAANRNTSCHIREESKQLTRERLTPCKATWFWRLTFLQAYLKSHLLHVQMKKIFFVGHTTYTCAEILSGTKSWAMNCGHLCHVVEGISGDDNLRPESRSMISLRPLSLCQLPLEIQSDGLHRFPNIT